MAQRTNPMERTYTAALCRRNALYVLGLARTTHPDAGFDAAGVRWLYNYIESTHIHLPDDMAEEFVQLMGCFYGECLRESLGGSWAWSGDQLGLKMDQLGHTFPFRAVAKQLAHGQEASLYYSFSVAADHLNSNAA